jgi:4-hydroxythreonine-4-phosphate dehydrogenase
MGDPAGIGGELAAYAWRALRETGPGFVMLADPDWMGQYAPVRRFDTPDIGGFAKAIPVIPITLAATPVPGVPNSANAQAVIASIEQAVRLAQSGAVEGVVTNPISKAVLTRAGFPHPGHTEFLAALTGLPGREVMMLAAPCLSVVPVTIHVALRVALDQLSTPRIVSVARTTHTALRQDFGIASPRLAMAGLNPHAGESGTMGAEETTIIQPAIDILRAEGMAVSGPHPPDTMFTPQARAGYDAAICQYHDQALIPLKTLDMWGGVNVTLGLPIVRTSPDHGTAFDIAGRDIADGSSLIAAIRLASRIAANRAAWRNGLV